ncbi:MAG: ferrochelatase, partial [Anaerolineales bacterium]
MARPPSVIGVLVMAYGGPGRIEDVEPYLLDVRGGHSIPPPVLAQVKRRYQLVGGRSPILERTRAQANALQAALDSRGAGMRTYVGMRHWHPRLAEAVAGMAADGVGAMVGLVMAPHYSRLSVEMYYEGLTEAIAAHHPGLQVARIDSWKDDRGYLGVLRERTSRALLRFPPELRPRVELVCTAHSLPERILEWNDPYPGELRVTFDALREAFPGLRAHFAYQSAGMTPEPWLGPEAGALMEERLAAGAGAFLVVPMGFVSEHVEILY